MPQRICAGMPMHCWFPFISCLLSTEPFRLSCTIGSYSSFLQPRQQSNVYWRQHQVALRSTLFYRRHCLFAHTHTSTPTMEYALARPAMVLGVSVEKFGDRLAPHLSIFRNCFKLASDLTKSPENDSGPLESQIELLDDSLDILPNTDILYHHITALSNASAAFGCVAADNPAEQLEAISQDVIPTIEALKKMNDASHFQLADAVTGVLDTLKSWIKDNLTTGIGRRGDSATCASGVAAISISKDSNRPPRVETKTSAGSSSGFGSDMISPVSAVEDDSGEQNYSTAFKRLIAEPLAAYLKASNTLGGEVAEQAALFKSAWEAEAEFLQKALCTPKPDEGQVQMMLDPIADRMSATAAVTQKLDPRGPFSQHCNALSESVSALGWIAVEEKATAFVGDMAGAGQFFIDKVKMNSKKESNPEAHREWAKSLQNVFAELKAYVKEHHTQRLVWNPPKRTAAVRDSSFATSTMTSDEESNYVTAFKELIDGPLVAFVAASNALGGDVQAQAVPFAAAWKAEAEFLEKAIVSPKPEDFQEMLAPIAAKMGEVGTMVQKVDPRGPYGHHCNAVGESVSALGWVAVDEKATAFVGDMSGAGQFYLDKVKMEAKKAKNPKAQQTWAKALEVLYASLKAYVKEHHTQKLVWNPAKTKKPSSGAKTFQVQHESAAASDYVTAFRELISGPLAIFLKASDTIGNEVKQQAEFFAGAWKAEEEFLAKAFGMKKPESIDGMVLPIAEQMGKVASVAESIGPRAPLAHHCSALGESVPALGWVAVEEKATAFVGDMAGAGQFFLDKVKMEAKKTDNPDAHRSWAKSLEDLYAQLKAYVKEYHTQSLVWNPPKGKTQGKQMITERSQASTGTSDYVAAFDSLLRGPLAEFVNASEVLGGEVKEQASALAAAWEAERDFLSKAIAMAKPDDISSMLAPIATKMGEVSAVVGKVGPRDPFAQHCNAVGESVGVLGWVAVDEKATAYVGDTAGAGQFFVDKVKMDAKKTDNADAHRRWAQSLETLLGSLKSYVKEYHTQKLVWNAA